MTKASNGLIRQAPWINRLEVPGACLGTTRLGREGYPCRQQGYWQFDALPTSPIRSGSYCWSHLLSQALCGHVEETVRFEDWRKEHTGAGT